MNYSKDKIILGILLFILITFIILNPSKINEDRDTIGKRISDAYLPNNIRDFLGRRIISVGPADINGWSFIHMLSGIFIGLGLFNFNIYQALSIHTFWELFQASVGDNMYGMETLIDISLDTIFFSIGYFLIKNKYIH